MAPIPHPSSKSYAPNPGHDRVQDNNVWRGYLVDILLRLPALQAPRAASRASASARRQPRHALTEWTQGVPLSAAPRLSVASRQAPLALDHAARSRLKSPAEADSTRPMSAGDNQGPPGVPPGIRLPPPLVRLFRRGLCHRNNRNPLRRLGDRVGVPPQKVQSGPHLVVRPLLAWLAGWTAVLLCLGLVLRAITCPTDLCARPSNMRALPASSACRFVLVAPLQFPASSCHILRPAAVPPLTRLCSIWPRQPWVAAPHHPRCPLCRHREFGGDADSSEVQRHD